MQLNTPRDDLARAQRLWDSGYEGAAISILEDHDIPEDVIIDILQHKLHARADDNAIYVNEVAPRSSTIDDLQDEILALQQELRLQQSWIEFMETRWNAHCRQTTR